MFLNKVLSERIPCSFTYKYLIIHGEFPGVPVVESLPANGGGTGLIPGPGTRISPDTRQLHACTTTTEAQVPRICALQQEHLLQEEACACQLESSPHSPKLEKADGQQLRSSIFFWS